MLETSGYVGVVVTVCKMAKIITHGMAAMSTGRTELTFTSLVIGSRDRNVIFFIS